MTLLPQTPSQTVGPFFHYGLIFGGESILAGDRTRGERIVIIGRVLDGNGEPVTDAMIELWQADAAGIYAHPDDPRSGQADPQFRGFGRSDTTHAGTCFRFETVKPGRVPSAGVLQAPHVCLRIFARGLLTHLATRVYFSDESDANASDSILASVPPDRRKTLIATPDLPAGALTVYRLDLVLQGNAETVFFEP